MIRITCFVSVFLVIEIDERGQKKNKDQVSNLHTFYYVIEDRGFIHQKNLHLHHISTFIIMTSTFTISRLHDMSDLVEIGLPLWIEGVFHQLNLHLHHDLHLHHFSNLSLMEIVVKGEAGLPLWVEGVFEGLRPPHLLPLPANSTLKIFRLSVWIFAHVTLCII